jgi:hypothetical protein
MLALIIPGLLSAVLLAGGRYKLESHNKAVELALDYPEIQSLSVSTGTPIPQLLQKFKAAGITGISVNEDLVGDLIQTGQASYEQEPSKTGPVTVMRVANKRHAERLRAAFRARLAPSMVSSISSKSTDAKDAPYSFEVKAAPATLNAIGLGLSPETVQLVEGEGLDVVARLQNHPALTKSAVDAEVASLKQDHVQRVICAGEEVYGYRGLIPYVADKFGDAGLYYGAIEFGKQKGDQTLSEKLHSSLIRVHSIASAEMATMTPSGVVERFVRAAKERNIRLCYVRLFETSGNDPVGDSVACVSSISRGLRKGGFSMAVAHPYGENRTRKAGLLVLIALSVAAATVMLVDSIVSMSSGAKYGVLLLGFILGAGMAVVGHEKGIQILALWAAMVFPTLGVTALVGPYFNADVCDKQPIGKTLRLFLGSSIVSLCGALTVVGLLADRSYMVKVDQFMGIKAAHGLPLLFVVVMVITGLPMFNKPWSEVRTLAWAKIRRIASNPLFVWHVIAVFAALGIVTFALVRTGNDPGVGVSGLELKFRAILDRVLVVRPRTKEFLIGHPALFIGIAFLLSKRRSWGLPLVILGMLGQVSLVNTFCHIHTPLSMSIIRIFNGLVLGVIISLIAWRIIARYDSGRSGNA